MDNENGTINCIYICNMYMFFHITYFMLYNNILLNSVLLTLNGTHVVVKKHFCSSKIICFIIIIIIIIYNICIAPYNIIL